MSYIKLNLGAGEYPLDDGWINLDNRKLPGIDLVCDINKGLPFEDESVDALVASHVMEHLTCPHCTMREIHRVVKPGVVIEIRVPLYQIWQGDHRTCFYERWFHRNARQWKVVSQSIEDLPNIWGETYKQMTVFLRRK